MTVPKISLTDDGLTFSRLVWGLWRLADWNISTNDLLDRIHTCLDLGITTFDHADIYGSYQCEELFGEALAREGALRDKMQIVTKCGIKLVSENRPEHSINHYDTTKKHIIASAERSLKNLHTDHIDVLLIHRPDPLMDADAIAEAFTRLRSSGKVRYFGVSNFNNRQFKLLASRLDFDLVTNQLELSPVNIGALHDGTLDFCQQHRINPMIWSPYAGGRLFKDDTRQVQRLQKMMKKIGEEVGGAGIDQIALAWILKHPSGTIPIIGTGKTERIKKAVKALDIELSREQWFNVWRASTGTEVP